MPKPERNNNQPVNTETEWMPRHQAASAALINSPDGRILMVANPYRRGLVLAGGIIEPNESPAAAAVREVEEETGLVASVTRLLVVEHLPATGDTESGLRFVFDVDPIDPNTLLVAQPEEVDELLWLTPPIAISRHVSRGRNRLAQALRARAHRTTIYLDSSRELPSQI